MKHFFVVMFSTILHRALQSNEDQCGGLDHSMYSAAANQWQSYLQLINQAKSDYVECGLDEEGCSKCYDSQIDKDLDPFKEQGITEETMLAASNVSRVTKYQIIDHKLYRSDSCMFPFRCRGIEHFLLELLPDLPNTEFYLNTRDWPLVGKYLSSPLPVLSFSKTRHYWDIMYPAWTFWEGGPALTIYPNGLGRWDKYMLSLAQAAEAAPWPEKEDKAFFRGSRTSSERDPLILLSRKCPKLVDAAFTKNQAWKSEKDTLGQPPAAEVNLEDHCRYKYLFNYRGVAASFRFKHLFLCRSLVFHVGEEWDEFFYASLIPWYHYVPVPSSADSDTIQALIEFVRDNDEKMAEIAENGATFITKHLKFKDISCYWKQLLMKYTTLLRYTVSKDNSLIPIR